MSRSMPQFSEKYATAEVAVSRFIQSQLTNQPENRKSEARENAGFTFI
jgi:hypothetical protein